MTWEIVVIAYGIAILYLMLWQKLTERSIAMLEQTNELRQETVAGIVEVHQAWAERLYFAIQYCAEDIARFSDHLTTSGIIQDAFKYAAGEMEKMQIGEEKDKEAQEEKPIRGEGDAT